MKVSDIGTRVKRAFGDELGAQISDADIVGWINEGMRELALANNLLQVKGTLSVNAGVAEYPFPADVLTLHSVKWQGNKLLGLSMQEADEVLKIGTSNPTGTPTHFWIWAGKITLYPAPEITDVDDLTIYYTKVPTDVVNQADTPEVPIQYHNRLVEYCIAQAAVGDDNLQLASMQMQNFEAKTQQAKDNQDWDRRDFYPTITVLDEDINY